MLWFMCWRQRRRVRWRRRWHFLAQQIYTRTHIHAHARIYINQCAAFYQCIATLAAYRAERECGRLSFSFIFRLGVASFFSFTITIIDMLPAWAAAAAALNSARSSMYCCCCSAIASATFPLSIKNWTKSTKKKEKEIRNSTKDCSLCVLLGRLLLIAGSFWSIVRRFDLCARFKCLAALFVVAVVVVTLPASRRCRCKFVLFVAHTNTHTHRDIHTQAGTAGRQASASSSLAVYSNFIAKLPTGSAGRESERASKIVNIYISMLVAALRSCQSL